MPLFLVEHEITLIPILKQYRLPEHGIYAVYPERAFMLAKLKGDKVNISSVKGNAD